MVITPPAVMLTTCVRASMPPPVMGRLTHVVMPRDWAAGIVMVVAPDEVAVTTRAAPLCHWAFGKSCSVNLADTWVSGGIAFGAPGSESSLLNTHATLSELCEAGAAG